MVVGLIMLVVSMSESATKGTTLPWSSLVFSLGVLITSTGVYLRAGDVDERFRPTREAGQARQDLLRLNGMCSVCMREPAIIRCTLHDVKICWICLSRHDTAWCDYAPCGRKSTAVGKGAWR